MVVISATDIRVYANSARRFLQTIKTGSACLCTFPAFLDHHPELFLCGDSMTCSSTDL
jgi:hypothetical protein